MLTTMLSRVALSAVPGAGPVAAVLVPILAFVVTKRDIDVSFSIR